MTSIPMDHGTIKGPIAAWFVDHANAPTGLSSIEFKSNTLLAEIVRRMCSMTTDAPLDENSNESRINQYVADFIGYDNDDFVRSQTLDELDRLGDSLLLRIRQGYVDLRNLKQLVARTLIHYRQILELRVAKDPVLATALGDKLNTEITFQPMVWTPLFSRYTAQDIIQHAKAHLQVGGTNSPDLLGAECIRLLGALRSRLIATEAKAKVIGLSPEVHGSTVVSLLNTVSGALAAHQQVDKEQIDTTSFDNLVSCLLVRNDDDTTYLVRRVEDMVVKWNTPGGKMEVCLSILGELPEAAILDKAVDGWLTKCELSTDTLNMVRHNYELYRFYLDTIEALAVFAMRTHFAETVLYPNGLVHSDNYELFRNKGGNAELLAFYVSRLPKAVPLHLQDKGITLSAATFNLDNLASTMDKEKQSQFSDAERRLEALKIAIIVELIISRAYPNSIKIPEGIDISSDEDVEMSNAVSMEYNVCLQHLTESVRRQLVGGQPLDNIFYTEFFKFNPWHNSFAKVLHARLGQEYIKRMGDKSEVTETDLTEAGVAVISQMMLEMVKSIAIVA